jgi:hypothetical protein
LISTQRALVFAKVNDLRTWQQFSLWAKCDPHAKATFAGSETGADRRLCGRETVRWRGHDDYRREPAERIDPVQTGVRETV